MSFSHSKLISVSGPTFRPTGCGQAGDKDHIHAGLRLPLLDLRLLLYSVFTLQGSRFDGVI